jgi:hypothetical protein
VLPELFGLIQSIGTRMAYDAAVADSVESDLVDLYVVSCIRMDPTWYVENAGLTRRSIGDMESAAVDSIFPRMEELLVRTGVEAYISAPIVSDEGWEKYVASLPVACSNPKVAAVNMPSTEPDLKREPEPEAKLKPEAKLNLEAKLGPAFGVNSKVKVGFNPQVSHELKLKSELNGHVTGATTDSKYQRRRSLGILDWKFDDNADSDSKRERRLQSRGSTYFAKLSQIISRAA